MTVKELRDILANVPDTAEVAVEDLTGKCLSITANMSLYLAPIVYLGVNKDFPWEWYNENFEEINL